MFSELIVAYLFLGGTGAGACLVCCVMGLLAEPTQLERALRTRMTAREGAVWDRFFSTALLASLAAQLIGALCLLADLGRPDRLLVLLFDPAPTYAAFGAWALIACFLLTALLTIVWKGVLKASRLFLTIVETITIIVSAAVMTYTGLMLSDMQSVAFWNTPWLVVLFALSSLSCGIALVLCSAFVSASLKPFERTLVSLAKIDMLVILAELLMGIIAIASVWLAAGGAQGPSTQTDLAAIASIQDLLTGPLALLLWGGFLIVGLAVPFVQDIIIGKSSRTSTAANAVGSKALLMLSASLCVLIGGMILRYVAVTAALHPVATALT